eukprot:2347635-Prymnesium_polylepis.1
MGGWWGASVVLNAGAKCAVELLCWMLVGGDQRTPFPAQPIPQRHGPQGPLPSALWGTGWHRAGVFDAPAQCAGTMSQTPWHLGQ